MSNNVVVSIDTVKNRYIKKLYANNIEYLRKMFSIKLNELEEAQNSVFVKIENLIKSK